MEMSIIHKINECLQICFDNSETFINADKTSDIDKKIREIITSSIPNLLKNYLNIPEYIASGSVGKGRATKSPWIALLDSDITHTTQDGVYIVFIFSSDYKHIYLTINQGTTTPEAFGVRLGKKEIVKRREEVRSLLKMRHPNLRTDGEVDVVDVRYRKGVIYYSEWNVKDDVECQSLLDLYVDVYRKYKEKIKQNQVERKQKKIITLKYIPYMTALRTKPFMLLAGISGTGKSRIVRKLAQATTTQAYENDEDRWKDNRPENFELIQVKPNWHNSMDVVGFYSNISNKYEFTPFVEFIVKAWQHTGTPYFLCLDEMNLAPVEEYFAEFLSAIESRSTDKDGNYVTDPIIKPFKEFGKEACEEMLKHFFGEALYTESNPLAKQFAEKGLTLPPNLMVMGTVNMDETTFSFSRKVLDRAMSVEMNEVDYDSFLSGESDQFPVLTELNELLVNRPQQASEVKEQIDSEKVIAYLKAVNELMEGTPFKLGYRAANEALLYVSASKDFAGEEFKLERSLDEFTMMKILSRLEGDDNRLAIDEDDPRIAPIGVDAIIDNGEDHINLLNSLRAIVRKHIGTDTSTEKKINAMYRTLEREHFVSYWA